MTKFGCHGRDIRNLSSKKVNLSKLVTTRNLKTQIIGHTHKKAVPSNLSIKGYRLYLFENYSSRRPKMFILTCVFSFVYRCVSVITIFSNFKIYFDQFECFLKIDLD